MRTWTETHREGTDMGPIDWEHPIAAKRPALWREAEQHPSLFLFSSGDGPARAVYAVRMYDGWPYWTPRPAILHGGVLGVVWDFFDSYGVDDRSLIRRPDAPAIAAQDATPIPESP